MRLFSDEADNAASTVGVGNDACMYGCTADEGVGSIYRIYSGYGVDRSTNDEVLVYYLFFTHSMGCPDLGHLAT